MGVIFEENWLNFQKLQNVSVAKAHTLNPRRTKSIQKIELKFFGTVKSCCAFSVFRVNVFVAPKETESLMLNEANIVNKDFLLLHAALILEVGKVDI